MVLLRLLISSFTPLTTHDTPRARRLAGLCVLALSGLLLAACQSGDSVSGAVPAANAIPTATLSPVRTLPPTWTPTAPPVAQDASAALQATTTQAAVTPTPTAEGGAFGQTTKNYGSVKQAFESTELWDIFSCDLSVAYTLDMSRYTPGNATSWTSVGVTKGAQGWMNAGAPATADTDPEREDPDDQFLLTAPRFGSLESYNALSPDELTNPPIGDPQLSTGIWFDRDGIASDETARWGRVDGATYNTGGIYHVNVTFHAIDNYTGTMFATVNGQETGFYDIQHDGPPDYIPVGKSFTGEDLSAARVYALVYGYGVEVRDLTVTGCPTRLYVAIDIQSEEGLNCVRSGEPGTLPVVIYGDPVFAVSQINLATLRLEQLPLAPGDSAQAYADYVNDDQYPDLVMTFRHAGVVGEAEQTFGTVSGELWNFTPFEGSDDICVTP